MSNYQKELKAAIRRSHEHGFLAEQIKIGGKPKLNEEMCARLSGAVHQAWPTHEKTGERMPALGMCVPLNVKMLPHIQKHSGLDAWVTVGWVYDIVKKRGIWRSSTTDIANILGQNNAQISLLEMHTWITLSTGEAFDVSIYPSLAKLFPEKFGVGLNSYTSITQEGISMLKQRNLPCYQYHPQFVIGAQMLNKLAIWGQ